MISGSAAPESERTSRRSTLTLVGFALNFEFRVISRLYSRILQYFSSWVDLQEIVKGMSTLTHHPAMRDSLIAFGFAGDTTAVRPIRKQHSAGTDAIRMMALLVNLLSSPPETTLQIDFTPRPTGVGRRKKSQHTDGTKFFYQKRPSQLEFYPFAVRVKLNGVPSKAIYPRNLYKMFAEYNLTAVGTSTEKKPKIQGWVCLSSLEELEKFIKQVNGLKLGGGVWEAVSHYDSSITPARTAAELREFLEARMMTEAERKKELRRKKVECGVLEALMNYSGGDGDANIDMLAGLNLESIEYR